MHYEYTSSVYDIMDVLFFRNKEQSPRTTLLYSIPNEPIRVLDLCAGTCTNSILIAENKPLVKITALDLSAKMLKVASDKIRKKGSKNIEMVVGDATKTGYPDKSFDVVILSLVLHEMNEFTRRLILNEAKRVLTDDGRLFIIEWEQPKKIFRRVMFRLIKLGEPRGFEQFLEMDLAGYLQGLGFNVTETIYCDYTIVLHSKKLV